MGPVVSLTLLVATSRLMFHVFITDLIRCMRSYYYYYYYYYYACNSHSDCRPVYPTSGCDLFSPFESFVDSGEWMQFALACVSGTSMNISPFSANWTWHSSSSPILGEKLWSRVDPCEKLLSRSPVCLP